MTRRKPFARYLALRVVPNVCGHSLARRPVPASLTQVVHVDWRGQEVGR